MSISPGDILKFVRVRLKFKKSSQSGELKGERGDESLMKLVESNLDSDFVSEKESDLIGVS